MIVVAIRRASGAIFLAGFRDQGTDLPGRCGKRALMMMRLVPCHLGDQKFQIVAHTLLHRSYGERCPNERSSWPRFLYIRQSIACHPIGGQLIG